MGILSCLSSQAEKPQKWMQICLFYHPEYTCVSAQHVCAQAVHYAGEYSEIFRIYSVILWNEALPAREHTPTSHQEKVKKKLYILLWGQPHHLTLAAYIKQFTHLE